ncbi:MAG: hypothetical protein NUK65_05535 [Firmicutes bacterium]|nr:hypothetical protein [Bacillota bacterium]
MSGLSILFFLLAALYLVGTLLEFPLMFDGNPKSRWLIDKIGKKNTKIVFLVIAAIFAFLAFKFK